LSYACDPSSVSPVQEEATMLRLLKLPGAMVELAVGTMIVIVHLGLAGARTSRTLRSW
jgi:hypothetical protein